MPPINPIIDVSQTKIKDIAIDVSESRPINLIDIIKILSLNPQPPKEIGIVDINKLDEKSHINGQRVILIFSALTIKNPTIEIKKCIIIHNNKTFDIVLELLKKYRLFNNSKILIFFNKLLKYFLKIKGKNKKNAIQVNEIN
jgi:hypothetical protein